MYVLRSKCVGFKMLVSAREYNYIFWVLSEFVQYSPVSFKVFLFFLKWGLKSYVTAWDDAHPLGTEKALLMLWRELCWP